MLASFLTPLATGLVFGFALDRGRVSVPYTIVSQMKMQNFTMMRMFLAASAVSALCIFVMDVLGIVKRKVKPSLGLELGFGKFHGFGANILGGLLLGSGMALAGACPGTIWPQVADFRSLQQAIAIAGGLVGTIAFGYFEKQMKESNPNFQKCVPDPLADKPNVLMALSVGYIAMVSGAIIALNHIFPWQGEMAGVLGQNVKIESFGAASWDPLYAGIVVGLLQIPSLLSIGDGFGQSSGWVYMADRIASLFDSNLEKNAPYLRKARYDSRPYWQFVSAIGAIAGGVISQEFFPSPRSAAATMGLGYGRTFLGGFLLLFGGRLAGGCTSGHGLTGIATGSIGSMISVACMFIGGGITSILLEPSLLTQ